jgi:ISXO2-like transposase domain
VNASSRTGSRARAARHRRNATLNTNDSLANLSIGKDFAEHRTVAHTLREYVTKDGETHTQTVESFFAIIKRGINGRSIALASSTCRAC